MRQIAVWAALGLLCVGGCGGDDRSTRETGAFRERGIPAPAGPDLGGIVPS